MKYPGKDNDDFSETTTDVEGKVEDTVDGVKEDGQDVLEDAKDGVKGIGEKVGHVVNNFSGEQVLEGSKSTFTVGIACLATGLFIGSYLTKRAPIELIISHA